MCLVVPIRWEPVVVRSIQAYDGSLIMEVQEESEIIPTLTQKAEVRCMEAFVLYKAAVESSNAFSMSDRPDLNQGIPSLDLVS